MRGAHARPPPPPRAAPPRALARSTLRRHPWAHLRAARRYLSARNIPYLNLLTLDHINARDILRVRSQARAVVPCARTPGPSARAERRRLAPRAQAKKLFISSSAMGTAPALRLARRGLEARPPSSPSPSPLPSLPIPPPPSPAFPEPKRVRKR